MIEPTSQNDLPTTGAKIELNLSRLSQLFNSFDPSPFHERDLDENAEEYIVSSAEEIPHQRPISLLSICPPINCLTRAHPASPKQFTTILHIAKHTKGGASVCYSTMAG